MAPSILSTLSSVLLLTSSVSATKSYQVVDSYDSTNFLDKFGFFVSDHTTGNYNDVDPTGGYVSYKSAAEAQSMGLLKMVGEDLYLGVDSKSTIDPNGIGRSSVRIESKTKYKQGLFVASFSHLPKPVCGAWPAFWTVGNPWPQGGEIDIYESWNLDGVNKVVLHTDEKIGECRIDGKNMTGTVSKPNCANFAAGQADNEGCAGLDPAAPFGSPEGGVYAMEWKDDAIRVWGFTHGNVPADLSKPETFGTPSFTTSTCAADKLFTEAKLIMNIDLCGVAGQDGIYNAPGGCAAKTGVATCKEWVAKNPAAFADVYFQLKSIKIYSLKEEEAVTSAVTSQVPSTVASTSAAQTAVSSVSSGIASEKPVETASGVPTSVPTSAPPFVIPSVNASVPASVIASGKPAETPVETPAESLTTRLATSTVYETSIKTITSCKPEVTNCPARHTPVVVTEVVAVSTTICPVFDVSTKLTVSKTDVVTVTSCAGAGTSNCAAKTSTITTQEVIATTTAIPVESYIPPKPTAGKPTAGKPVGGKPVGDIPTEVIPAPTTEGEKPAPVTTDMPTVLTTYKTNIITVTSCAPEVVNCPARVSTIVTSQVISTTVPVPVPGVPGVPATPTHAPQNPPVPGSGKPATPGVPGAENPTTPGSGSDSDKPSVPIVGVPPVGAPTAGVPTAGVPTVGVPPVGVPHPGETASAQKPVSETPGAPPAMPTTLVVAPSSPFNGTLTSARTPVGTGSSSPCIGAACPATTTGPVLAGAGKLGAGSLLLAAALAVFAI